jgi:Tfp pilus assembly protein PilF
VTFDALERADPNSPWVHLLKGQAYDGLAQFDKSIEEFKAALQQQPNDATVRCSLGFLYWKTRHLAEAEAELAKAVELDPSFREAKFYLADTYLIDQKPEQAIPLLKSIVAQDPHYVRARVDLGKAFSATGHYADAATQLEAAVHLEPTGSEAHYFLARVYKKPRTFCPASCSARRAYCR